MMISDKNAKSISEIIGVLCIMEYYNVSIHLPRYIILYLYLAIDQIRHFFIFTLI